MNWTKEMIEEVANLAKEGWSSSRIAVVVSSNHRLVTRNAVIGIIHRKGLRPVTVRKPPKPKVKPVKTKPKGKPVEAKFLVPLLGEGEDAEGKQCRWPIGDPGTPGFRFCGHPQLAGKSYCETHHRVSTTASIPPGPRKHRRW